MNKLWERYYPLTISLFTSFLLFIFKINPKINGYEKVLDGVITFSSIVVGFLAALLAIILSLSKSDVVQHLFLYGQREGEERIIFLSYIKQAIYIGFLGVIISIVMYILKESTFNIYVHVMFILWSFVISYFVLSALRIINIIMVVLTKQAKYSRDNFIQQNDKLDKDRIRELRSKGIEKNNFNLEVDK